jgi:hypothetical protein
MDAKKPLNMPETLRNFTEIVDPKPSTFKMGTKNQRKLERIRQLAKQAKGTR